MRHAWRTILRSGGVSAVSARDVLLKAAELLDSPERWTQGAMARDVSGRSVLVDNPHAVCWCLEGALDLVRTHLGADVIGLLWIYRVVDEPPFRWNDMPGRTWQEVHDALLRAADLAEPGSGPDA